MKTVTLPVSDCGMFLAGDLTDQSLADFAKGDDPPGYGVIIWYRDKETAKEAFGAAVEAHWGK
jgi:hypothetical protein